MQVASLINYTHLPFREIGRAWVWIILFLLVCSQQVSAEDTKIKISKETTHILGPIDKDGHVDYFAALRNEYKKGVTKENNAAVLLWQAWGPAEIPEAMREKFFKELDMEVPPKDGMYMTPFPHFEKEVEETGEDSEKLLERVITKPWKSSELPAYAKWLKENEAPIKLMFDGTHRTKMYYPFIRMSRDEILVALLLPSSQSSRQVARCLCIRSMNHLGEGRVTEAIEDVYASHRLARLMSKFPFVVDQLIGAAIHSIAKGAELAILETHPSEEQLIRLRSYHKSLGKPIDIRLALDKGERMMYLDAVISYVKNPYSFSSLSKKNEKDPFLFEFWKKSGLDLNVALRMGNVWYDKAVAIGNVETYTVRKERAEAYIEQMVSFLEEKLELSTLALSCISKRTRSELIGKLYLALFLPAANMAYQAEARTLCYESLLKVAIELELYHAKNGNYPEKLSDLEEAVYKSLPNDLFSEKPFHYARRGDGYLLYSVGPNMQDDHGSSYVDGIWKGEHLKEGQEDDEGNPIELYLEEHDDFAIRLPLPKLKWPVVEKK